VVKGDQTQPVSATTGLRTVVVTTPSVFVSERKREREREVSVREMGGGAVGRGDGD
jgi:hypothetical protein